LWCQFVSLSNAQQLRSTAQATGEDSVKVAFYARVSTADKGQDPELQLRELRARADTSGWEVAAEYVDRGVSGTKERRPELDRLMRDANRGAFQAVAVWKLDRFGRSLRHLVNAIAELEARGIAFISLRDNIDLSTPAGRLMFQIIGAMAEFERALIAERVRAGLAVARARGKRLGRPRREGLDPAKIAALREQGRSWSDISLHFGAGIGTVRRAARVDTGINCPPSLLEE
jgi:DNA invertase Pin-like site-specific DNA recombinase